VGRHLQSHFFNVLHEIAMTGESGEPITTLSVCS
jgi:hypothetical protein